MTQRWNKKKNALLWILEKKKNTIIYEIRTLDFRNARSPIYKTSISIIFVHMYVQRPKLLSYYYYICYIYV